MATRRVMAKATALSALAALLAALMFAFAGGAGAQAPGGGPAYPEEIALPDGFQPEGVAISGAGRFYVGSLATGGIFAGDLRTGQGELLAEPVEGRVAVGLALDAVNRLFVAGGPLGQGFVYDTVTGESLAALPLAETGTAQTFVNDVIVADRGAAAGATGAAAYFTDSMQPVVYQVALHDDAAPTAADVTALPLTGDLVYEEGFNVNGIEVAPDGSSLLVVQSNTGRLYRVDPATGGTEEVDLGAPAGEPGPLTNGDGLLVHGSTVYAVRNQLNEIAVVALSADAASGRITGTISSEAFDVPTTIGRYGDRLYAVNARFGVENPMEAAYSLVAAPAQPDTELGLPIRDRIAGPERIATAVAVSQSAFPDGAAAAYLARADLFADALAAASLRDGPVLLVPSCGDLPPDVATELRRLDPERVAALGGTAAVCDAMLDQAVRAAGG